MLTEENAKAAYARGVRNGMLAARGLENKTGTYSSAEVEIIASKVARLVLEMAASRCEDVGGRPTEASEDVRLIQLPSGATLLKEITHA